MNTLQYEARESASIRAKHANIASDHRTMIIGCRMCLVACLSGILVGITCAAMGWTL